MKPDLRVIGAVVLLLIAGVTIFNTPLKTAGECIKFETECWTEKVLVCNTTSQVSLSVNNQASGCTTTEKQRCADKCTVFSDNTPSDFVELKCEPGIFKCDGGLKYKCHIDGQSWLPTQDPCNDAVFNAVDNSMQSGVRVYYDTQGIKHITQLGSYIYERDNNQVFSAFAPLSALGGYTCSDFPDVAVTTNYQTTSYVCPSSTKGGCKFQVYTQNWGSWNEFNMAPGTSTNPFSIAWGKVQGYDVYFCNQGGVVCTDAFKDNGCGAGTCANNEMQRTRNCPSGFVGETKVCVYRSQCATTPSDPCANLNCQYGCTNGQCNSNPNPTPKICEPGKITGSMCDTASGYYKGKVNGYKDIIYFYCNDQGTGTSPVKQSCLDQKKVCSTQTAQCVAYQWEISIKLFLSKIGFLAVADPYLSVYYP